MTKIADSCDNHEQMYEETFPGFAKHCLRAPESFVVWNECWCFTGYHTRYQPPEESGIQWFCLNPFPSPLCTHQHTSSPMQNFPNWNHALCFPWNVQAICHNSVWVWAISLWIGAYQFLLLFVLWGRWWGSPRPPTLSLSDQMHTELFSINNGRRFWKMYCYLYFYWIFH